jgi:hypothetical protein
MESEFGSKGNPQNDSAFNGHALVRAAGSDPFTEVRRSLWLAGETSRPNQDRMVGWLQSLLLRQALERGQFCWPRIEHSPVQLLALAEGMGNTPYLTRLGSRIHAAIFSFCAGVMLPMPILDRSLL